MKDANYYKLEGEEVYLPVREGNKGSASSLLRRREDPDLDKVTDISLAGGFRCVLRRNRDG